MAPQVRADDGRLFCHCVEYKRAAALAPRSSVTCICIRDLIKNDQNELTFWHFTQLMEGELLPFRLYFFTKTDPKAHVAVTVMLSAAVPIGVELKYGAFVPEPMDQLLVSVTAMFRGYEREIGVVKFKDIQRKKLARMCGSFLAYIGSEMLCDACGQRAQNVPFDPSNQDHLRHCIGFLCYLEDNNYLCADCNVADLIPDLDT